MSSDAQKYAGTKVLVMADKWLDCRQETQALAKGPQRDHVRALGRYQVAGDNLAQSVEELRKAPGAQHG